MNLQQVNRMNSQEIYEDLHHKIETLEYMPGDALSENELAAKYHTSRHMVRGAFAVLKQDHLIEVYPQQGTFVSLISRKHVTNIMFLRDAAEQLAIRELIADRQEEIDPVCDRLQQVIDQQNGKNGQSDTGPKTDNSGEQKPAVDFDRLDSQFHKILMDAVGRSGAMELLSGEMVHFRRWRNLDLLIMGREPELPVQHQDILNAIRSRDAEQACRLMHAHINSLKYFDQVRKKTAGQYFYEE